MSLRIVKSWEIREDEDKHYYSVFRVFCELPDNSLNNLAKELKRRGVASHTPATLKKRHDAFDWQKRKLAYLRFLSEKKQASIDEEIKKSAPEIARKHLNSLAAMHDGLAELTGELIERVKSSKAEIEAMPVGETISALSRIAQTMPRVISAQREAAGLNHAEADVISREDLESMLGEIMTLITGYVSAKKQLECKREWISILRKYLVIDED